MKVDVKRLESMKKAKERLSSTKNEKVEFVQTVVVTSDHSGVALKKQIVEYLVSNGYSVEVQGSNSGTAPDDYPDFVKPMAEIVLKKPNTKGIIICGSGVGISIAANKINGIYSAHCDNPEIAYFARTHNNSNVLALGARYTSRATALKIVEIFLKTPFEGGRHERRIQKIKDIENEQCKIAK